MSKPVCDLACVKDAKVHEFKGPVKIVLVDPPADLYNRRKSGASFIALANMMIGANTVIILLFTLGFKLPFYNNVHVILCTAGFCMPLAILMLDPLNGPASPLKKLERRREHVYLHILGLLLGVGGGFLAINKSESVMFQSLDFAANAHKYAGLATSVSAMVTAFLGPFVYVSRELEHGGLFIWLHRICGMLTFLISSICFILGLIKPSFQIWLFVIGYLSPTYVMLFFTLFYTLTVLVSPGLKLLHYH